MAEYNVTDFFSSNITTNMTTQYIYGLSRIGSKQKDKLLYDNGLISYTNNGAFEFERGNKSYEMSNHLGNVLTTVSDKKLHESEQQYYVSLDGTNDELYTATISPTLTNQMTIEAWVRTTQSSGVMYVAEYVDIAADKGVYLKLDNGKAVVGGYNDLGSLSETPLGSTNIADGEWHHVVGTMGGDVWQVYVDGVRDAYNLSFSMGATLSGLSEEMVIGHLNSSNYYEGDVKEVSLWDYQKTIQEIQASYLIPYSGNETGLIGYWKLDDNTNPSGDYSSSSNSMTLNGASWNSENVLDRYIADQRSKTDYYAFGMPMPGRNINLTDYEFGFNGMRKENDIRGDGNSYSTMFREYDPRIGRWTSRDPLFHSFPWQSPYAAFDNNPILLRDPLGLAAEGGPEGDDGCQTCPDPSETHEYTSSGGGNWKYDEDASEWIREDGELETFNYTFNDNGVDEINYKIAKNEWSDTDENGEKSYKLGQVDAFMHFFAAFAMKQNNYSDKEISERLTPSINQAARDQYYNENWDELDDGYKQGYGLARSIETVEYARKNNFQIHLAGIQVNVAANNTAVVGAQGSIGFTWWFHGRYTGLMPTISASGGPAGGWNGNIGGNAQFLFYLGRRSDIGPSLLESGPNPGFSFDIGYSPALGRVGISGQYSRTISGGYLYGIGPSFGVTYLPGPTSSSGPTWSTVLYAPPPKSYLINSINFD